jgi:phage protein U
VLEKSDRPWGRYEVLQESPSHKVKCIWVSPGKRLSYQRHQKRSEHWFIVSGNAQVTINGVVFLLEACIELQMLEIAMWSLLKSKLELILGKMTLNVSKMILGVDR